MEIIFEFKNNLSIIEILSMRFSSGTVHVVLSIGTAMNFRRRHDCHSSRPPLITHVSHAAGKHAAVTPRLAARHAAQLQGALFMSIKQRKLVMARYSTLTSRRGSGMRPTSRRIAARRKGTSLPIRRTDGRSPSFCAHPAPRPSR